MASGADIPPELFMRILRDVCEDAEWLLLLSRATPNRKEAIKNVTACSLTCVYWARFCRRQLFSNVWIKNCEDMRTFLSLVVNTPTRFPPISEHAYRVTLGQRVGARLWLHLAKMQPSLFRFWSLRRLPFNFHIEDSPADTGSLRGSTSQRLFASLPRTPPSSCLQFPELTIDNPYFMTPHDLVSFLRKFSLSYGLRLTNVTWSAQADFASDLLVRNPLNVSRWFDVGVYSSKNALETTWLALITMLRYSPDERQVVSGLQVLPSAQRVILDISRCLCQGHEVPFLRFYGHFDPWPDSARDASDISVQDTRVYLCCKMEIQEYELTHDGTLGYDSYEIKLVFYSSQMAIPANHDGNSLAVDCISVLCVRIQQRKSSTTGHPTNGTLNQSYPWAEVVGLCATQTGFIRLQLEFESYDGLVQFMEAQRAALGKLHGRITLFYQAKWRGDIHAADFETLADLGDAEDYGYIYYETAPWKRFSSW